MRRAVASHGARCHGMPIRTLSGRGACLEHYVGRPWVPSASAFGPCKAFLSLPMSTLISSDSCVSTSCPSLVASLWCLGLPRSMDALAMRAKWHRGDVAC